jgi:hypothetical protein
LIYFFNSASFIFEETKTNIPSGIISKNAAPTSSPAPNTENLLMHV